MITTVKTIAVLILICFASQKILADTHYVSPSGGNSPPYTNWADAAHNIQDAVDASIAADVVLVTNGIYSTGETVTPGFALSNRVVITKNISSAQFVYGGELPPALFMGLQFLMGLPK